MREVIGISGNYATAMHEGVTERLRLVVEDDGTIKALTAEQLNERDQETQPRS